uniref:Uncharacterized protein n=1 Tax=Glycine max TaxID=3847 RepID=C6TIK2_SOYBN|nr:unknown [Glycine max]
MFPKRFRDPKTGFHLLSSMNAKKYLKNIGLEREDYYFFKRVGKAYFAPMQYLGLCGSTITIHHWGGGN